MPVKNFHYIDLLIDRYPTLSICRSEIVTAIETIIETHRRGGKILICGNGGSAADAEHIVGELAKSFVLPRIIPDTDKEKLSRLTGNLPELLSAKLQCGLRAFALSGSSPLATAIANDGDAMLVYAQMTYVYGQPGDVFLGISTKNIVAALTVAKAFSLHTIGLTGSRLGSMDPLCETLIKVPAIETFKIQEYHLPIYHAICLTIESEVFQEL